MSLIVSASAFGPVISHAKQVFLNKIMKSAPSASPFEKSHFHQLCFEITIFFKLHFLNSLNQRDTKA